MSGADKALADQLRANLVDVNVALADASQTITVVQGRRRTLATLTADRTYPISPTGATRGDTITIERSDATQWLASFVNGGPSAGTIFAFGGKSTVVARFDGTNWKRLYVNKADGSRAIYARDFGAVGDDVTDDTAAIQAAFNVISSLGLTGELVFENGTYVITDTISFVGEIGYGIRVRGAVGGSLHPRGTRFRAATGLATKPMFHFKGAYSPTIENIEMDAKAIANCCLWVQYDHVGDHGSTAGVYKRCTFRDGVEACVLYGEVGGTTVQADQTSFYDSFFVNYSGPAQKTITSIDTGTNKFTSVAHDYVNGNIVRLSSTGALPTYASATLQFVPFKFGAKYYIVNADADTFELSATSGGATLDVDGVGSGTIKARKSGGEGFKVLQGGNCKGFRFFNTAADGCDIGFNLGLANGPVYFAGCSVNAYTTAGWKLTNAIATLDSCYAENPTPAFWIDDEAGGSAWGSISIYGGEFNGSSPNAEGVEQDVMMRVVGGLLLDGVYMSNTRTASSWPVVSLLSSPRLNAENGGAVTSRGTHFRRWPGAPSKRLIDASGNDLEGTDYGALYRFAVSSDQDSGGDAGGSPTIFKIARYSGQPEECGLLAPRGRSFIAGVTWSAAGRGAQAVSRCDVSYVAFTSVGGADFYISLGILKPMTRIVGCYLHTTTPWAGVAGTITARVGYTGGQEWILDHDVKTTVVLKGTSDGDLGTAINAAGRAQGAHIPSATDTQEFFLRITIAGGGALADLTAGVSTLILLTEYLGVET